MKCPAIGNSSSSSSEHLENKHISSFPGSSIILHKFVTVEPLYQEFFFQCDVSITGGIIMIGTQLAKHLAKRKLH